MHHLPAGTVTMLFTDIEGSTNLLQRLSERYPDALAQYRSLLRAAFDAHNGQEVDTQGDSFFVVFARASDAISAAVEVQRTLFAHAWPDDANMRVRIGVHTGEPQRSAEGYVGLDVHHAARIMSVGHGGQVLLSAATCELVKHDLPDGVSLRDLGDHRLKDLQHPSHLFQLHIEGLPIDFPPLKTLDSHPNNLPIQPTPFIGRDRQVAAIVGLLNREDLRLVTLTGPGGTGKTRLGLQVAAELSDTFVDGVYFVNLAPLSDATPVIPTIAQALNVKEIAGQPLLDLLKGSLHWRHLLLVLDNFEQVVDAAVDVAGLLAACPNLKVLVTSRMSLHVRGEQEFAVPPLTLPDPKRLSDLVMLSQFEAVALFIARAQSVKPEFQVTNASAPTIAEICTRLDGLPLAIELAATRIKLLPPQALLARLSQRLAVLTGGARDAPARQQTLRNTIKWSYDLLDAQEQKLFRRLSVFVGGCTLEAIEAVCHRLSDEDIDVLDTLASLIDKSLLRQIEQEDEEPHFAMLETIREYGLEELAAKGELERTRQAHAAYFLEMAELAESGLEGREQMRWLKRLEHDHDNLRAATEWLLDQEDTGFAVEYALRIGSALRDFWNFHGHYTEGLTLLERALATHASIEPSLRSKALVTAGWVANAQADLTRAEALGNEALTLARECGDPRRIAAALQLLGGSHWSNPSLARAQIEESLALSRALGDSFAIAWSAYILGLQLAEEDDATARSLFEESLEINRAMGTTLRTAGVLAVLAGLVRKNDPARARALLEEGLSLAKETDHRNFITAMLLINLGQVMLDLGEITIAKSLLEDVLQIYKELGVKPAEAGVLLLLGYVATTQEDYLSARSRIEKSLALGRECIHDPQFFADGLEGLAEVVTAQGEPRWAARLCGAAEAMREAGNYPPTHEHPDRFDRAVVTVRIRLGEQVFAEEWALGRTMPLEQVLVAPVPHITPLTRTMSRSSVSPGKQIFAYPDGLTTREVEVLRLIAQGLTNDQVAEQLVISPRTVNTHLTSIYGKIGVSSRSAATRYAIDHKIV